MPPTVHSLAVAETLRTAGVWLFSVSAGAAAWVVAQADSLVDLIPQGTVAGLILAVSAFLLRWTYRTARTAEERYAAIIEALEADNARKEEDLANSREEIERWRALYEAEYLRRFRTDL